MKFAIYLKTKKHPKISNLALIPQPWLLEMKLICQLTGATSENHI